MKTLTIIFLLLAGIAQAQIDTASIDTTTRFTKYAIVSISDYYNFNADISVKKKYALNKSTERVYPMNPEKYVWNADSTELMVLMTVYVDAQDDCPYPLLTINEIPNPIDTLVEDIEVELIDQKTYDWMAKHYEKAGDKKKRWIWVDGKIDKEKAPKEVKEKTKTKD